MVVSESHDTKIATTSRSGPRVGGAQPSSLMNRDSLRVDVPAIHGGWNGDLRPRPQGHDGIPTECGRARSLQCPTRRIPEMSRMKAIASMFVVTI